MPTAEAAGGALRIFQVGRHHQAVATKAVHLVALSSETVMTVAMIDAEGLWRRKRRRLESDGARDGKVSVAQYVMPSPYS